RGSAGGGGRFFGVFRPRPPPLSPVDDEARVPSGSGWALSEVTGTPLGTNDELVQGLLEDRQEPMNPMVDLGLTQAKEFAHDGLKGIGLEVNQDSATWPPLLTSRWHYPL